MTGKHIVHTLTSYLVDRAVVATTQGRVEGVVLALRSDGREFCVAMSKEDAIILSAQLQDAGLNAREIVHDKLGIRSE